MGNRSYCLEVIQFGPLPALRGTSDTWQWDGNRWTQRQDFGPKERLGAVMVFDENRERMVLFGGESPGGTPGGSRVHGDTWELPLRAEA